MLGHPHYRPPQNKWMARPGPKPCHHGESEWFSESFDCGTPYYGAFASAADIYSGAGGAADQWNNKLMSQCNSMRDFFFIPYHAKYGTTLYVKLLTTPDLFIYWHDDSFGCFYLRVGCTNCSSVTPPYKPHRQLDDLGLNPQRLQGNALRQSEEVQQAFRSFLARILKDRSLLKDLHMNVPPGM